MTEEAPPPKKIEAINYRVKGRFEAVEEKVSANDASISALKQRLAAAKLTASARAIAAAQVCAWHPCMPASSGPHVS